MPAVSNKHCQVALEEQHIECFRCKKGIHQINNRLSAAVRGGADSAAPMKCMGTALASQLMLPAAKAVTSVYGAKN